jgi:hypothetical protein
MSGFKTLENFISLFEVRKLTQILKRGIVYKINYRERRRNKIQVPNWK